MSSAGEVRSVTVISAVMNASGLPDFALTEVEVTPDEAANGVQYDRVEEHLVADGYEEPFVHFAGRESPDFLVPAVRQYLGLPDGNHDPNNRVALEES